MSHAACSPTDSARMGCNTPRSTPPAPARLRGLRVRSILFALAALTILGAGLGSVSPVAAQNPKETPTATQTVAPRVGPGFDSKWPPGPGVGVPEIGLARYIPSGPADQLDEQVRLGFDHPAAALARIDTIAAAQPADPQWTRQVLLARGLVGAFGGMTTTAIQAAEGLLQLTQNQGVALGSASANLIKAVLASQSGQQAVAGALAQAAMEEFSSHCQSAQGPCDYRAAWQALHLLDRRAVSLGMSNESVILLESARQWAQQAQDPFRAPLSQGVLAFALVRRGQLETGQQLLQEAVQQAERLGNPRLQSRLLGYQAQVARSQNRLPEAIALTLQSVTLLEAADAPHLLANTLTNLSDLYAKVNQPQAVLATVERAVPLLRRYNDKRALWVIQVNAGLTKIQLGRLEQAKQDLAEVLQLLEEDAALSDQADVLQEFGEALAAAGDAKGALELYHRERKISETVRERDRQATLKDMQARFDSAAKQRRIELAEREIALRDERLRGTSLRQRVWFLAALVLALSAGLLAMLYLSLRKTQLGLRQKQQLLKRQAERDPLTQLGNRRHFLNLVQAGEAREAEGSSLRRSSAQLPPPFTGALLLLDLDHFKQINDTWGHGAGDEVLRGVAQRLESTVRGGDVVVRWGGEEFLIWAPGASAEHAEQMARRALECVAAAPFEIRVKDKTVSQRVTLSVGFACFPLGRVQIPLGWSEAVDCVDAALYAAKQGGRNMAVGLLQLDAPDNEALMKACMQFLAARSSGQAQTLDFYGPGGPLHAPEVAAA
jgi:diguanylate cyclase (GGDEF)-like protein